MVYIEEEDYDDDVTMYPGDNGWQSTQIMTSLFVFKINLTFWNIFYVFDTVFLVINISHVRYNEPSR